MNSIGKKLTLVFMSILILFSSILAISFYKSYENNYYKRYIDNLEVQAKSISKTLENSEVFMGMGHSSQERGGMGRRRDESPRQMMRGFNSTIKILDETILGEIQLVSRDNFANRSDVFEIDQLDDKTREQVNKSFAGKTDSNIYFNSFLNKNTITVSTPITRDNNIEYVLLLNMNVDTVEQELISVRNTFIYSLGFSLLLGILIISIISRRIVSPIKKIEKVTDNITRGKLGEITNVKSNDEIGQLASNIDKLSATLKENKIEEEKLEQNKRDFIADISHELRTPVAVMRASIDSIVDGVDKEMDTKQIIDQMSEEINLLEKLVNDLLSLSKLENLAFEINKEEIFVNQLINDAIRGQRMIARKHGIEIQFMGDANPIIEADYSLMKQLISILISNAIKHTEDTNVYISSYEDRIEIENKANINNEILNNIFNRFYKDGKDGTGLGLAIAKEISNRHNFDILAEQIDDNIRFTVQFNKK